jgi:hypothetical protein
MNSNSNIGQIPPLMSIIEIGAIDESFSTNRILIVDDQKFNIDALFIILEYYVQINPKIYDFALDG